MLHYHFPVTFCTRVVDSQNTHGQRARPPNAARLELTDYLPFTRRRRNITGLRADNRGSKISSTVSSNTALSLCACRQPWRRSLHLRHLNSPGCYLRAPASPSQLSSHLPAPSAPLKTPKTADNLTRAIYLPISRKIKEHFSHRMRKKLRLYPKPILKQLTFVINTKKLTEGTG